MNDYITMNKSTRTFSLMTLMIISAYEVVSDEKEDGIAVYKSLGGALKELVEKTRKKKKRSFYEDRLEALRKSAGKARAEMAQQQGSRQSVTSENVYG